MGLLLTEQRARELVQMPKRLVRSSEFAWQTLEPPKPVKPGKKVRVRHPRALKARLIEVGGREQFVLSGDANGSFGFNLTWQDIGLTRIDSQPLHRNPAPAGTPREQLNGPHVHYFVPGYGLANAYLTAEFDQSDIYNALSFFLRHCNVQNVPDLQEAFALI